MKPYIIIVLIVMGLFSCTTKQKHERLISYNSVKYWDIATHTKNDKSCVRGYCFRNNGKYQYFLYYKNKRYADDAIDIVLDRRWKCTNDSFFILEKKTRIIKLTKDSFVFQFNGKSIVRLVSSKNQTDTVNPPLRTKITNLWDTIHVSR